MSVRWPTVPRRLGLGVGLDLPWSGDRGFTWSADAGDHLQPATAAFLSDYDASHAFLSWQPKGRGALAATDYEQAWRGALAGCKAPVRALHHTALNLAASDRYDRAKILAFTNDLTARHDLRWINEDLGFWSLIGKPLPYPLPPLLTDAGLAVACENVAKTQAALDAPLVVEFPGFSKDWSLVVGPWDAYDFFRALVTRTAAPCTLDTGHLLSWRWHAGHRGAALLGDLERLPLAHCFEIHLSGSIIDGDRFVDAHHGVLLDDQLDLLELLLARCPNVRAITYEDPRFDEHGALAPEALPGLERLRAIVQRWLVTPILDVPVPPPVATTATADEHAAVSDYEHALSRLLHDREQRESLLAGADDAGLPVDLARDLRDVRRSDLAALGDEVLRRLYDLRSRGVGRLIDAFPTAFDAWRARHPDDPDGRGLIARFAASAPFLAWSHVPDAVPGVCIEHAFCDFLIRDRLIDAAVAERALLVSVARALLIDPAPNFHLPAAFFGAPGRWLAVQPGPEPFLVAAVGSSLLTGAITPLLADLLHQRPDIARVHGVTAEGVARARAGLVARGLLPASVSTA